MFDSDAQNSKYSSHDTRFQSSFAILSLPSVSPIAWTSRNALNGTMTFLRASIETSMVWCEPWINDIWLRSISDVAPKLWQPMSVCRWTDTQTTIADCLTLGVGGGGFQGFRREFIFSCAFTDFNFLCESISLSFFPLTAFRYSFLVLFWSLSVCFVSLR